MRTKYYIYQLSPLLLQPSFTRSEAEKLGVSGGTLAYYVNKGLLERVGPGIFFDPTNEIDVEHKWRDLFRVLYSVKDGVVCLITALDYYGLTEEISRRQAQNKEVRSRNSPGVHFQQVRIVIRSLENKLY